ncbi:O-acetyl-ADP-ribose deacetylase [Magnetofaba australis]|uniref:Putative appr-1-p processing domain-containing protein n=1 Tax=Magnetofaba australis IT-1 TaxID=1434232 RepID=A0A1Y2K1E9_9PROT|nr:O-acetyl-ADP-ribose deacetylase [Magnetofaba australis]OSM01828.1 putative appr-1-p processing domain-containing protein [Magnetofaba australis IT-1]
MRKNRGIIRVEQVDITTLRVDAIVNAANRALLGGGGVDGAIHRAGGLAILRACEALRAERYPDGLPIGEAVATPGGELPARWVIHTVGPVYDQDRNAEALLAACYRNSLHCARELNARTVAFPAISTGVYGYPKGDAAQVAVRACAQWIGDNPDALLGPDALEGIILVAFSAADAHTLQQALDAVTW